MLEVTGTSRRTYLWHLGVELNPAPEATGLESMDKDIAPKWGPPKVALQAQAVRLGHLGRLPVFTCADNKLFFNEDTFSTPVSLGREVVLEVYTVAFLETLVLRIVAGR